MCVVNNNCLLKSILYAGSEIKENRPPGGFPVGRLRELSHGAATATGGVLFNAGVGAVGKIPHEAEGNHEASNQ